MAKEKEDNIAIIRTGDYLPELEEKVKLRTATILATNPPKVHKKFKHVEIPEFGKDKIAFKEWGLEEIRRCREGYDGLPGKYYYYLNHTKIKHKSRGKIRPDFRTMDLEWFKFLEKIEKDTGKGIVCVKRRQVGMSWKAAVDVLYDCQFHRNRDIGMNSKSENDSRALFAKVKMLYRNQSDFLRVATSTDRRDALLFARYEKDQFGNNGKLIAGTESSIVSVSPAVTAHAGNQYLKLIMDESGEVDDVEGIFANAEDCLIQDGVRVGTPIIFGTMGDTDKAGKGLMEFWKNHDKYDLEQFPFWGYNELIMDELGNDDIENSVRWIIYKRHQKEGGSTKIYNKFIQKYPFDEQDAFLSVAGYGIGNPMIIAQQELNIMSGDHEIRPGRMKLVGETPQFEPNPHGKSVMYELPQNIKDGYTSVLDPAEDDNVTKTKDSSDLGFSIMSRPFGLKPPEIVFEYCDRPQKLEEAYKQIAWACILYRCKIHIEMNKGGWRAYDWFNRNYPELLALGTKAGNSVRGGVEMRHGVKMNQDKKLQMEGLLNQHLDNYCLPIPEIGYKGIRSAKFLKQCKVFAGEHQDDDLAVSVGWNLIIQQSDKKVAKALETLATKHVHGYQKVNGVLRLVTANNPTRRFTLPSHPLFKR
jgi:hypothetical protein